MKRYCEVDSVSNVLDCHNAECRSNAHYYSAEDVQALCREVLPHIDHKRDCELSMNGECSCDLATAQSKLKAIIEAKP